MRPNIRHSALFLVVGLTLLTFNTKSLVEAKQDTLKNPLTVTKSVQLASDFKVMKIPTIEINPPVIEPVEAEPKVEIDNYNVMNITAYTSGFESTQKKKGQKGYGITASGKPVQQGLTAACPKSMPFGTKIYIQELNHTYECHDRGGRITEGHVDIYCDDLKEARQFGRQKLKVKIIEDGE